MTVYTMFRCFLVAGLLLIGCGDDPTAGTRTDDAGTGGVPAGDAGPGGSGGTAMGTGGATADAGTGGVIMPGTGGAGSGGAVGSGGMQGSGGAAGGAGGTIAGSGGAGGSGAVDMCVDPMGWKIKGGLTCGTEKGGRLCVTNCTSIRPGGTAGNYIGPPMHPECWSGDFVCVASCSECQ